MANDGGMKDKISNIGKDTLHYAARVPKKAAESAKGKASEAANGLKLGAKDAYNKSIGSVERRAKGAAGGIKNAIKDPKGALINGAASIGGKSAKKVKEMANKIRAIRQLIAVTTKVVKFIITWIKPIAIVGAVVLILGNLAIFALGVAQSVSPSPHYYCDLEANRSVKNSTVYQQYCKRSELAWNVDNINGHYIVQDGPGPAASCAMANMLLRFYTIETSDLWFGDTNVYDYLWQSDGQYNNRGNSVGNSTNSNNSLRNVLNNYNTTTPNEEESAASMTNGSREFATLQGKSNYTMSNWGYLRDETIDIKDYVQTDDYYNDNSDNKKWIWDLSLNNKAPGSNWRWITGDESSWDTSFRLNVTKFNVEQMVCPSGDEGYAILKKRINDVLSSKSKSGHWTEYYKGSAGIMVQYTRTGGGDPNLTHTILITKHTADTWYGVDSSLGTSGGYEGPLDGSGNFVADDSAIAALLNSDSQTISYNGYSYTLDRIGYCTRARFGFWF